MYFYLQAASIKLFGDSVAGVRVVSALIGTLAVLFTYLLARRLFGRTAALLAAAFLAVYHYHLFFSRVASVQVADTLFVVASLYFLDRAFGEQRRVDAVLAGIALGFSQYFSFAGRLMLPVLGAYLLFALVRPAEKRVAPSWATDWQPRVRLAGWVLLSATVTAMPLLAYYVDHPIEFVSRLNQVSMLASGWLANELQATGKGAPEVIWWQIQRAILLPFYTPLGGWYRGGPPLAGEPAAVLMAIGMTLATLLAFHRRYFGLAVAYWGAVVGLGLTDDASATQRFVIVAPLLAIFLALGVYTLMRIGANLVGFRRADLAAVVAAGMVALAAWNIDYYFITPGVTRLYGDGNSLIATELGYYLRLDEANPTVYFFGVPRMAYRGFSSLPFIARRTHAIDVEKPWTSAADVPVIESPTAFVFLPGHEQELALVRQQYPGGVFTEFRFDQGGILFTVYEVVPQ
jgi:hypothetical protein